MSSIVNKFPLSGAELSAALSAAARTEQLWTLTDIETLADPPALALGDLWRRAQVAPVVLKTFDLCAALDLATQVISLDVRMDSDASIHVIVEDGVVVDCQLP